MALWQNVPRAERGYTLAAFLALFGISASHLLLETARDALFLMKVAPERLPLVYIAISVAALVITRAQRRRTVQHGACKVLAGWLMLSGVVTIGFWAALGLGDWIFYLLYVWSGVMATLVIVHFWTLVNDHFTAATARRAYATIGLGSILGAVTGTGLARVLSEITGPRHLVLVAALVLIATAFGPVPKLHTHCEIERSKIAPPRGGLKETLKQVFGNTYPRLVTILVALTAVTLTFADYVFKTAVVANVAPDELARFLSTVYLALTIVSLIIQLLLADEILKRFSIFTIMGLLPLVLLFGGAGFAAASGVITALVIKSGDGALRHALHRTANELLYVPMSDHLRSRAKLLGEILGQRGGQTMASVSILGLVTLGAQPQHLGIALIVLTASWLGLLFVLPRHYLDNFRRSIGTDNVEYPDLDNASAEALRAALDSPDDGQVIAALQILGEEGNASLVPNLMLHHPSHDVVRAALDALSTGSSPGFVEAIDRALERAPASLRPALIRARVARAPDVAFLEDRSADRDYASRTTAMVYLVALGHRDAEMSGQFFESVVEEGEAGVRLALAEALVGASLDGCEPILRRLAADPDPAVRVRALEAMRRTRAPEFLPILIDALGVRALRSVALETLRAYGDDATVPLLAAMEDDKLPGHVRWQIPDALAAMGTVSNARALLEAARTGEASMMRYRCLRALDRMPKAIVAELATGALEATAQGFVERAVYYLDAYVRLEANEETKSEVRDVLVKLLADKELRAIDSLLLTLSLMYPAESFGPIRAAIARGDDDARSSARELLEAAVGGLLQKQLLALTDLAPPEDRRRTLETWFPVRPETYEETVDRLAQSKSEPVAELASRHRTETAAAVEEPA